MRSRPEVAESSVWIDAPPAAVWAKVADIENLGQYSPETERTEWSPGVARHEVGARFRGYNVNDRHRWHTECTIIAFSEPEEFGFGVAPDAKSDFGSIWRYRLTPERGGTRLSESFESPILRERPAEMSLTRRATLIEMLGQTLAAIKADLESA